MRILIILIIILTSCHRATFNSEKWKDWDGKESYVRWDMADDLRDNYSLIGQTREQIENLLGQPDNTENSSADEYYYDLGPCRRGIDFGSFTLSFKKDKVYKVRIACN